MSSVGDKAKQLLRIFICGAHSAGKTTLQRHLAEATGVYAEPEVARPVIVNMELTRDQFDPRRHPAVFERVQREILRQQCVVERRLDSIGQPYICDRGLDPLVYASLFLGAETKDKLLQEPFVQECLLRHRQSLVFVVNPHKRYIVDDGFRLKPEITELRAFTRHMLDIFDELDVRYRVVTDAKLEDKLRFVIGCLCRSRDDVVFAKSKK